MPSHSFLPALVVALLAAPAMANAQQAAPLPHTEGTRPIHSSLDSFFGRHSQLPTIADTSAPRGTISTCPMPVARPDTTRLERMPRARLDSVRMAPMPVAHGCLAEAK